MPKKQGKAAAPEETGGDCLKIKFPRTEHLMVTGEGCATRDDLVMDKKQRQAFFGNPSVIVEEKIDGSNLGISIDPEGQGLVFQNRGKLITHQTATQWNKLENWSLEYWEPLQAVLRDAPSDAGEGQPGAPRFMLFGEWMTAKHSIQYDQLPGWFVAFDIYDLSGQCFLTVGDRNARLAGTGIPVSPLLVPLGQGVTEGQLEELLTLNSAFASEGTKVEGCYFRIEGKDSLQSRGKVVNAGFLSGIEAAGHWTKQVVVWNVIRPDLYPEVEEGGEGSAEGSA